MAKKKAEPYDLDAIQKSSRKITSLLKDRHPGLVTWSIMVKQAFDEMERLLT